MDAKQEISDVFEKLLYKKDGDKITVKDVVEECGISRQTFYYHFQDIPDVVAYSLQKKMNVATMKCSKVKDGEKALEIIISELWDNRKYLKRIKESKKMYMVENILIDVFRNFLNSMVEQYAEHVNLPLKDIRELSEFYACGIIAYMIRKCEDKEFDIEGYAKTLDRMLRGELSLLD